MTRSRPLLAGLALFSPLPRSPATDPPARRASLRCRQGRVRIEGRPNVQATIDFGEDEHIENVAIGDSSAWQVTPNKRANLLFVKPLRQARRPT